MKTLKYAIRFLVRAKAYTVINLVGLSFSLACCIVLARYIHRELTVDTHCVDREKVYVVKNHTMDNCFLGEIISVSDSIFIDPACVEAKTEVIPFDKEYVMDGNRRHRVRALVTDSVFLHLFRYPVIKGEAKLKSSQSVLLMKDFADRVYGDSNPIGKVLKHSNGKEMVVEGVIDLPSNKTFFDCDIILSIDLSTDRAWSKMSIEFYKFLPGTDMAKLAAIGGVPRYMNNPQYDTRTYTFSFLPVKDIYWDESFEDMGEFDMFNRGHRDHLYILEGVGLLLLLTGLLNFVNLYLITLTKRARGYGLRKVFGASNRQLFIQIFLENFLLVVIALALAWLWVGVSAEWVNQVFDFGDYNLGFDCWITVGTLLVLPLITSVYPCIKYVSVVPTSCIRSNRENDTVQTRMAFLGIQYILTFVLIVLSVYFNRQLQLLITTEPGFRTKEIILANLVYESNDYMSYTPERIKQRQQRVRMLDDKLDACPDIAHWEANFASILDNNVGYVYLSRENEEVRFISRWASPSFFEIYDLNFVEGGIPKDLGDGPAKVAVVNCAAFKALGYDKLEGAVITERTKMVTLGRESSSVPIVAVIDDYYVGHLSAGKLPTVFFVYNHNIGDLYQIACVPGRQKEVVNYLHQLESEVYGSEDFDYSFLEDRMDDMYRNDRRVALIYSIFAFIAIIISSMGLFGISLFDIRQRYKEIGIRKVNGAKVMDIWRLLFRKYLLILGISFAVAVPVAIMLIHWYTESFVMKAPLDFSIFLFALLVVSVVALGTLWWQVNRASRINPADVIKIE